MESVPVQKWKVVFLGDMAVGKTSIINRFIFDNFTGNEQPTVGVDFVSRTLTIDNNRQVRLQLWDTAGQDRFHSLIPSYIRDSQAAIIIFDITNVTSFNNLSKWMEDVREVRGEEATVFVLGNKVDRVDDRKVNTSDASKRMEQLGFDFFEVSAKSGEGIKDFFLYMANKIAGGIRKSNITSVSTIEGSKIKGTTLMNPAVESPEKRKKGCC